jgi:hypothetical protein
MTQPSIPSVLEVQLIAFGSPTASFGLALAGPALGELSSTPPHALKSWISWVEDELCSICEALDPRFGCDFNGDRPMRSFELAAHSHVALLSCFAPRSPDPALASRLAPAALALLAKAWALKQGADPGPEGSLPRGCAIHASPIELEELELDRCFLVPPPDFMMSLLGQDAFGSHHDLPSTKEASWELTHAACSLAQKMELDLAARALESPAPNRPRL